MQYKIGKVLQAQTSWASAFNSDPINVEFALGVSLVVSPTVDASTARTFVDGGVNVTTNVITSAAHGFVTGRKVVLSNSGGALPGGTSNTTYYLIVLDADTFKLSDSLAHALAGTNIVDITSAAGGGTHSLTPSALSTASVKLQWSNDGITYYDIANQSQNITQTGDLGYTVQNLYWKWLRAVGAIAAGQISSTITANILAYR